MTGLVSQSNAGMVPSSDVPSPGIQRGWRGANPVNASRSGKRETAPLAPGATPRMKHPAINKESWAMSYAQSRSEPKTARSVGKRNSNRRMRSIRKKEGRR